ncbi:MAG: preprotein translocase subunit SecG [Candidatus Margulisbacteria bacterium]|nr:preprotein translocase subunit SecG [Candidatus Margulisiibacteriota bacterium]
MKIFLILIQLVSAFALIIMVLLHSAKGEGLGSIGNTAKMFSSQKGLEDGLNRITTIFASAFLGSAFLISIL